MSYTYFSLLFFLDLSLAPQYSDVQMITIGFIGFGRMGKNMVLHALENGVSVVGYNRTAQVTYDFAEEVKSTFFSRGEDTVTFTGCETIPKFLTLLRPPRIIFIMVKAGTAVDHVLQELLQQGLSSQDTIIDGGNSNYRDSVRRHDLLAKQSIRFVDCGTSGGLEGGRYGACLMLGGERTVIEELKPVWDAFAKRSKTAQTSFSGGRWDYMGSSGAGHFVKMVHNGVEYGMTQALGEGMAIIEKSAYHIPLQTVVQNWNTGSVVRSWLVELLARAVTKDQSLSSYQGKVGGGETGKWAEETAKELGVKTPVLSGAINARHDSQQNPAFSDKVVSALRFEYGGHTEE